MSLRFVDSFDHYATANLAEKWTAVTSTPAISAGNGRRGTQSFRPSTGHAITKTIDSQATWCIGFALRYTTLPIGACGVFALLDAGTVQVDLRVNGDGTLSVTRNGTAVTGGTSSGALTTGAYHYIEYRVTISSSVSANAWQVDVDGVNVITVTAGQSSKNTANATANGFKLGNAATGGSTVGTLDFDDLYACDGQGSVNNGSFLGDVAVSVLYPASAGNYAQWTPDSGSNYARVDETLCDGDSSYVETGTAGNLDSYTFGNLGGSPSSIFGVQWCAESRKTDASTYNVRRHFRSGGTDYVDSNDISLPSSYSIAQKVLETNPATSAAWTVSDLQGSEWGIKLNSVV